MRPNSERQRLVQPWTFTLQIKYIMRVHPTVCDGVVTVDPSVFSDVTLYDLHHVRKLNQVSKTRPAMDKSMPTPLNYSQ